MRIEMDDDWKYWHYYSQLQRTTRKVHENYVVSSLFHDQRFEELLPLTQYYLRRTSESYALIDLYYPQISLAIEIDEPHHDTNGAADQQREDEVIKRTGCVFHRISISSGRIQSQIDNLKDTILGMVKEKKSNGAFDPWQKPKSTSIDELKDELSRTLFVKIRGKIAENDLLRRQTGAWRLNDKKRLMVDRVVVVHDRVVTRAFEKKPTDETLNWQRDPSRGNKWSFVGHETSNLKAIGSLLSDWNYQATAIYSTDIENA